jgi:hypothetical protein
VQIGLEGGADNLYSLDPKEAADVRTGIGPVFARGDLLDVGRARFGPSWRALSSFLPRFQVINGILCGTVAHETGLSQMKQLRRHVISEQDETALTQAGAVLAPDGPVHCIHLDPGGMKFFPENDHLFVDSEAAPLLTRLHKIANDSSLRDAALEALWSNIQGSRRTAQPFRAVAHLLTRMAGTRCPAMRRLGSEDKDWPAWLSADRANHYETTQALQFEWALYILQNDLSPTVYFSAYSWDSHADNAASQVSNNIHFAARLNDFLRRLSEAKDPAGGTLLDSTGILITSELGRFPYTNSVSGKDHFPLISAALMGPGLRAGTYGQTGAELLAEEVSVSTGRPAKNGTLLNLDDLGATLFTWLGADVASGRRAGRVLDFALS